MDQTYNEIKRDFEDAKKQMDIDMLKSACNMMRSIAENIAAFYVTYYKLEEKYQGQKKKKNIIERRGKKNFGTCCNVLRYNPNHSCMEFYRALMLFLDLAQMYGNDGSHAGAAPERWEAEMLVRFFEKNIWKQYQIDCGAVEKSKVSIEDVTEKFIMHSILLYSLAANKYASAREDFEGVPICCDTDNRDAWETYSVEVDKDGWASFRASNGYYLSVNLDEDKDYPPIRAIGPKSSDWEKFKIYKYDGHYALKAGCNNKWVTCRIDWDECPLYSACDSVDLWEEFDIKEV